MIIGNANQFGDMSIEKILAEIASIGGKLLNPTISLCHHCHYHVPAYKYELDNKIYMCKHCVFHGIQHIQIESDAEFYHSLVKSKGTVWDNLQGYILTEVTDRCNADCPHCYHLPDNRIKDDPMENILSRVTNYPDLIKIVCLAGAEPPLRKDFAELACKIRESGKIVQTLTNGIKFGDRDFVKHVASEYGKDLAVCFGLNHPTYLNNPTIRRKQELGIDNVMEYLTLGYVGYTLVGLEELADALQEITDKDWDSNGCRIRCGSEIGRNATKERIFLSDIVKATEEWALKNNKEFEIDIADNNIYHVVVKINGKPIRIIQWCDETTIDMEELRFGPWCDFVPDGITNFLHQVIRRDVWKNKNIILPDHPPLRYQAGHHLDKLEIFKN